MRIRAATQTECRGVTIRAHQASRIEPSRIAGPSTSRRIRHKKALAAGIRSMNAA
jgi:hypothetical protein